MKKLPFVLLCLILLGLGIGTGALVYWNICPPEKTCLQCHEIKYAYGHWKDSAHQTVDCKACHGGTCEDFQTFCDNVRRVWTHFTTTNHPSLERGFALSDRQVEKMETKCSACHQREGAQWRRSLHASPLEKFLTNTVHNLAYRPTDQCLRCHGLFVDGTLEDILVRQTTTNLAHTAAQLSRTWFMTDRKVARRPAVSCLACHRGHAKRLEGKEWFYSRLDRHAWRAADVSLMPLTKEGKVLRRSYRMADRQCQQCHASNAFRRSGESDDRTPTGAHEGLSCLDCHEGHDWKTGATCGTCHWRCRVAFDKKEKVHQKIK